MSSIILSMYIYSILTHSPAYYEVRESLKINTSVLHFLFIVLCYIFTIFITVFIVSWHGVGAHYLAVNTSDVELTLTQANQFSSFPRSDNKIKLKQVISHKLDGKWATEYLCILAFGSLLYPTLLHE